MKMILSAVAAMMLSGCAGLTAEQGVRLGIDLYCVTITEAGKQVIGDHVTAGTPVLGCPQRATAVRP